MLEKKTVCRGYSGILRDCLKLLGFEVININGFNKNKSGHEWNQVKISRNWFNCDLTWDTFNILNKKTPVFLLTDDNDFYAFYKSENGLDISHSLYLN